MAYLVNAAGQLQLLQGGSAVANESRYGAWPVDINGNILCQFDIGQARTILNGFARDANGFLLIDAVAAVAGYEMGLGVTAGSALAVDSNTAPTGVSQSVGLTQAGRASCVQVLGPNLLLSPNGPYASGNWTPNGLTETTGQTDPLGGTTASLLTDTAVASVHQFSQALTPKQFQRYFTTVYLKPGTFTTGADFDMAATNGGGTVHVSNTGAMTVLSAGSISLPASASVANGFFKCTWIWTAPLAGIGLFTVSFGVGADNAPLSYTGTVQTQTFWGMSVQQST